MRKMVLTFAGLAVLILAGCRADEADAKILLENLAVGMRIHSVKTGGGGHRDFASSLETIKPFIMEKAYPALSGPKENYKGWNVRLEEFPPGDGFKTNFRLIAHPAKYYRGGVFCTDKSEKVSPYPTEN